MYSSKFCPIVVTLCAVLLAGSALIAVEPTARPVSVLVSATEQGGAPAKGLTKDQVTILDNAATATVSDVRSVGEAPLSLGIVLLASQSNFKKEQSAALELVQKMIRSDQDRAFIITAGGSKSWTEKNLDWQSDPEALKKTIGSLDKSTGLPDAFKYDLSTYSSDTATSAMRAQIETRQGNAVSFFDAVWSMMMADKRPARRVLVLFRNPWAHAPGLAKQNRDFSDAKHNELISNAQRLHVTVYAIGVEENPPDATNPSGELNKGYGMNGVGDMTREADRQQGLQKERLYNGGRANVERLASETGGRSWWTSKYNDAADGIANAVSGQYLVTFIPATPAPGQHKLKISASGGAKIAAPDSFLVAAAAPTTAKN
jgi:VWFA-related protein